MLDLDYALHQAQCRGNVEILEVLANRATTLHELSRHQELAECLERLWCVAPRYDYALGRLLQARLESCTWSGYTQYLTQAAADLASNIMATVMSSRR